MDLLLLCLPWMMVALFTALFVRIPARLPSRAPSLGEDSLTVSVIVPARNEEENIEALLTSLTAMQYPSFEILVVDDQSEDRTGELVARAEPGNARALRLIRGAPPPEGWFGKPWACFQGAREADGELLLFTDADTVHGSRLLAQAVVGLEAEGADVLTLIGRQVMGSFWERLLQPQFFTLLAARFPRAGIPRKAHQWRHAIANGQYLLFRREVYESVGGHEAVRGEVVEDLRMAQLLVRGGWRLVVREGRELRTRMYRSLSGLVEGWSKNITTGALQTTRGWMVPVILPLSMVTGAFLWVLPPAVLAWALASGAGGTALHFGLLTTGFGALFWGLASATMRGNPLNGLLYPLGSILAAYIFLLSWIRGGRIRWRGRSYLMSPEARRGLVEEATPRRARQGRGEGIHLPEGDEARPPPQGSERGAG
jgi:chlorobactene glucosyltransferase